MTVRDRGCGMDQGSGLGFRAVQELVAMSGGCLSVESQVDVGTSISGEWYGVKGTEAELQQDEAKGIVAESHMDSGSGLAPTEG
jgi:signal transduction histidine kinase